MPPAVKAAFRPEIVTLATKNLVPSRKFEVRVRNTPKYKQIATSLTAVGLIEPIVVYPEGKAQFRVLDGHKRFDILERRKTVEIECLIATDDETYTYNRRVNYLSTVAENQMILRALKHNSEETIAAALNVNVSVIKKKRDLLDGVCKEAIDILKDRRVSPQVFSALRKMKPVRQTEVAEVMVASNLYSHRFAAALLSGTKVEMLVEPEKILRTKGFTAEQRARLEGETDKLLGNVQRVEASYGTEALTLSVCCRYLVRIMSNRKMRQYIEKHHSEIQDELQSIVDAFKSELAGGVPEASVSFQAAGR